MAHLRSPSPGDKEGAKNPMLDPGLLGPVTDRLLRTAWLTLPVVAAALVFLIYLQPRGIYNPPYLLLALNFVFLTLNSMLVSALAARGYLAGQPPTVLVLGCGTLALAIGAALAGVSAGAEGPNQAASVYNTAVCVAGLCHLLSALGVFPSRRETRTAGWPTALGAYGGVALLLALQAAVVQAGRWPVYLSETGPTRVGFGVLWTAAALFASSALILRREPHAGLSIFRRWYSLALSLLAIGLVGVSLQTAIGDALNWVGRCAQYFGGLCLFLAVRSSRRERGAWELPLERAFLQSEQRFRRLVEASPTGIIVHRRGLVVYLNPAALELFGATDARELVGTPILDRVHPEYHEIVRQRIRTMEGQDEPAAPANEVFIGLDGRLFDVEVRWIQIEYGDGPAHMAVFQDVTDRKRSEEALRRSTEEIQRLALQRQLALDAAQMGWWHYDPNTRIASWDEGYKRIFDVTGYQRPNDEILKRLHPDDLPGVWAKVEAALDPADPKPYSAEYRIRRSDGSTRWIQAHGIASFEGDHEDRRATSFVGTVEDITERRHADETLRRYELLAGHSRDMILFMRRENGHILEANAAAVAAYGYSREELLGMSIHDLRAPETQGLTAAQMAEADTRGLLFETVHRRKDGSTFPAEVSSRGATIVEVRCLVSVVRDITGRRRVEAALRESESFYRQTLESIPGMVFTTRPDGYCDYQSQQWVNFTGVPMEEHLGDGWNRLLHPEDQPRALAAWRAAVAERAPYDLEYRVRRYDGAYEWFKVRGSPIRNEAGQIVRWFGTALNIDRLVKTQEALRETAKAAEEASRAKSDFLARMSHEIRTPMNGILGMTELALLEGVAPKPAEYLTLAKQSAKNLLDIINDILDLSRIEAGKVELAFESFRPEHLVESVVSTLSVAAQRKGLRLHHRIDAAVPDTLLGDEGRLRQVLTNLVGNAVKFTETGHIDVEASLAGTRAGELPVPAVSDPAVPTSPLPGPAVTLLFTVRDSGIGIPPENLCSIFESFSPATRSTHTKYGGTGLGLSIAKHLVELMGGQIWAETEPGIGSVFSFTVEVRLSRGREENSEPRGADRSPPQVRPLRILLAEDNAVNQLYAKALLQGRGHDVFVVGDGRAALEELSKGPFDVVLMDVQMPVLDGIEAARRIREGEVPGVPMDLPIIALTAHALKGDRERFLACGMDDYLSKPIDLDELTKVLVRVASRGVDRS